MDGNPSKLPPDASSGLYVSAMMLTPIAATVVGIVLLLFGRKLFWPFVGVTGFLVGTEVATALFQHQPAMILISALVLGLIGCLLAFFLQKVAVAGGGFVAGGFFFMSLLNAWALQDPKRAWISFLIGGATGAAVMIYLFDWALIFHRSAGPI